MINQAYAMKLCITHLKSKGHKNILYVNDSFASPKIKKNNFLDAIKLAGLSADERNILTSQRSLESGAEIVTNIINANIPFNAVICSSDVLAIGIQNRFLELGYKIPEDVTIIGYYDTILSRCCLPQLTVINTKPKMIGSLSIKIFENIIQGDNSSNHITVSPELIVRGST